MTGHQDEYYTGLPSYLNYRSRVVHVGDLSLGGYLPVRVQSMTNSPTMDTAATVAQVRALADAGCEMVRITARNLAEARHLDVIKKELNRSGIRIPLAADIHFLPEAADIAARIVEKVRINPGNFVRSSEDFSGRLGGLIQTCRHYGTALRVGVNHGSLSQQIMDLYGDTPAGMVESAMEYLRVCQGEGFHEVVVSMKASNILVVIQANRLLAARMKFEGMDYPIHLGVTEAGDGEDGRIKSAAGIGVLLEEGIGDTIRVSLTGDPVNEIPFALKLANAYRKGNKRTFPLTSVPAASPFTFSLRTTEETEGLGGDLPPKVVVSGEGSWEQDLVPDFVFTDTESPSDEGPGPERISLLPGERFDVFDTESSSDESVLTDSFQPLILQSGAPHPLDSLRRIFKLLSEEGIPRPVLIRRMLRDLTGDDLTIRATIDLAALLTDGFGDGIWIEGGENPEQLDRLSFGILQATRRRISRTEYIACPSCGRTQFNIEEALKKIREATLHLKGLKIAVMGCIVNGPGEMADADFGYVGAGPGKVHLYKRKKIIKRNVPEEDAVEELLKLIDLTT